MSQNYSYPSASTVTVAAIGPNLQAIPTQSILIAGEDPSLNLHPLQTDAAGLLKVSAATLPLPSGAATSANQVIELSRLSGSLVPTAYDEVDLTYVPSGAGVGQIATAVYKLASSTVKTLTMSYDGSDRLSSVVAS